MKIYEGKLELVGEGIWYGAAGGKTKRSVLEIGDQAIRNVEVTPYLGGYLRPGENMRVLIHKSPIVHIVLAIEVKGKKYKESSTQLVVGTLLKILLFAAVMGGALWLLTGGLTIPAIACLLFAVYEFGNLNKFFTF